MYLQMYGATKKAAVREELRLCVLWDFMWDNFSNAL